MSDRAESEREREQEHAALAAVIRDHFYATGNEMTVETTATAVIAAGFHLHPGCASGDAEPSECLQCGCVGYHAINCPATRVPLGHKSTEPDHTKGSPEGER